MARTQAQGPAWAGSTRKATLPPNWAAVRRAVLDRDGHRCTWADEHGRCGQQANQVDHMGDRDDHRLSVLRSLCAWHHGQVSARQGNAARRPVTARRPVERHPGLADLP